MTTTTPTPDPRPTVRRFRRLALAGALAAGTVAGLLPSAPASAAAPSTTDIVGALGYNEPGPSGYHVISWSQPENIGGKPVLEYQVERWDADLTTKLATYTQPAAAGPHRTIGGMPDQTAFRYRVRARNADGWGGFGGFEGTQVQVQNTHLRPFSDPHEFVERQVADYGVGLTIGQMSTWATSLHDRQDVTEFIDFLAGRYERRNRDEVIRLYFAYFGRAPEPAGLDYWQDRLDSGTAGLGKVSSFFASSQEFKTLYGGTTNTQFVTLVYQNVLFRNPEPSGLAYWKGRLDQGTITRGNLMVQFSESAEGKALRAADVVVADTYATLIRKAPTNGLIEAYDGHVTAGGTAGDLATLFLPLNAYP